MSEYFSHVYYHDSSILLASKMQTLGLSDEWQVLIDQELFQK